MVLTVYFGVDVGGTSIKSAIVSDQGEILYKEAIDTLPERGFQDLCGRLRDVLERGLSVIQVPYANVRGVGVGVPAFIDVDSGTIVEAVNLGWHDVPFAREMETVFQIPVAMENDANVAALGESWIGAGRDAKVLICATVGTGIGGGIVIHNTLHRGVNGMGGEIGHIVVDRNGPKCNCGLNGCLETLSSATAIIREAVTAQKEGRLPSDVSVEGAASIFKLADSGNETAQRIIADAGTWLGYGLSLAAGTLNPDVIVIGGGVSKAGEAFMKYVKSGFEQYAVRRVFEAAELRLAELGNDAGVIGAARLIERKLSLA